MSTAALEAPWSWTEVPGDHPSRLRLKVTDTSGNNQLGCIWGVRSRYYDSAATAALFYEAEALTPVNGAAVTGLSGASGGDVVKISSPPAASWVSMLSTTIAATTGNFTHQGSYRVWARCYSSTGTPQFQFLWGVGSLSVPVMNDPVTLPGSNAFYLLDLGEVRLDGPPEGANEWFGAVQVYSLTGADSASVDCLYLQPLDEAAGVLTYTKTTPPSSINTVNPFPGTGANNSSSGSVAWSNPGNVVRFDGSFATVSLSASQTSEWLTATNFGFTVPSGATIQGIATAIYSTFPVYGGSSFVARLIKAGTVQTGQWTGSGGGPYEGETANEYGGPTDLWQGTWAPSDVNNSGFGFAFQLVAGQTLEMAVDFMTVVVSYTLASGFTVVQDAVVYANETCVVRHDGVFRQGPSSGPYGPVSNVVGDLARLPPSGMEGRPCQVFVKPTRGDFNTLPDAGLDSFTVEPIYRATYIFRP